jgi:TolA-binding protein
MKAKNLIRFLLLFTAVGLLSFNCAGTKSDQPPEFADENANNGDLDDIEALLGITSSEETTEQPEKPRKQEDQLNFLEGNEVLKQQPQQQAGDADKQKLEQKITKLESDLKDKNREISNLKSELMAKDAQIENLGNQSVTSAPNRGYSESIGSTMSEEYDTRYMQGRGAFEAKDYQTAITYFESLLAVSTTNPLADNAQYWIGESHFALRQYDAAIIDFEKVLTFPQSNKNVDAQFKLGMCYARKGNRAKAVEEFERLNADYPGNRFEKRVNEILAKL